MAKRAKEAFVVATKDGKMRFNPNDVVPDQIAKDRDALVYDDSPKSKRNDDD